MTTIKVGDRVRVVEEGTYTDRVGQVGTVIEPGYGATTAESAYVQFPDTPDGYGHTIDRVELVESASSTREAAFAKAKELAPRADTLAQVALARFLMGEE